MSRPKTHAKTAPLAKRARTCSGRVAVALDRVLVMGALPVAGGAPVLDATLAEWRRFCAEHPKRTRFMGAMVELVEALRDEAPTAAMRAAGGAR